MKIVSINNAPAVSDDDGAPRADVTDIGKILDRIDECNGRNDALRTYILALRDLQRANDRYAIGTGDDTAIDHAQAKVGKAFDALIVAEVSLNGGLNDFAK